jgi:hypothetical protein
MKNRLPKDVVLYIYILLIILILCLSKISHIKYVSVSSLDYKTNWIFRVWKLTTNRMRRQADMCKNKKPAWHVSSHWAYYVCYTV